MNSVLACTLPADLQVNLIIGFLLLVLTRKPARMHLDPNQTVHTGLAGRKKPDYFSSEQVCERH